MYQDTKDYIAEIRRDMIQARRRDYIEATLMSIGGVVLAGIIVAFATWFTVG